MRKTRQPYEKARYAVPMGAHDAACMKSRRGEILQPNIAVGMTENETDQNAKEPGARPGSS
jgi:hypothetical protein